MEGASVGQGAGAIEVAWRYLDIGRAADALAVLDRDGWADFGEQRLYHVRGAALYELGRYADGRSVALSGLASYPGDIDLLVVLALCALGLDSFDEALSAFGLALAQRPEDPELLAYQALAFARAGDVDAGMRAATAAVRQAPGSPTALRVRAQVAVIGQRDDAPAHISALLAVDPENRDGRVLQGQLALRAKDVKTAEHHFAEAARLDPSRTAVAKTARETRIAAHPALAPARVLWQLGYLKSRLLLFGAVILLSAVGLTSVGHMLVVMFLGVIALSYIGPQVLRRHYARKHGRL